VQYWSGRKADEGVTELKALFAVASQERKQSGAQEFSEAFDFEILRSQQHGDAYSPSAPLPASPTP